MSNDILALLFSGFLALMLGLYILFMYRNLLRIIIGVEVMSKGITILFLAAGAWQGKIPQVQSLIVTFIIVETVLAAIMLALVVTVHKIYNSLDIQLLSKLKG